VNISRCGNWDTGRMMSCCSRAVKKGEVPLSSTGICWHALLYWFKVPVTDTLDSDASETKQHYLLCHTVRCR